MQTVANPSRLHRLQSYLRERPLTAWWVCVGVFAALFSTMFFVPLGKPFGMWFMAASMSLFSPTFHLLMRFSDGQLAEYPVSEAQSRRVARMFLFWVMLSIVGLGVPLAAIFAKRFGWHLTTEQSIAGIMLFSFSTMLSLGFGYCARHTTIGKFGLRLLAVWWTLLGAFLVFGIGKMAL